jgi:hypothetical protein
MATSAVGVVRDLADPRRTYDGTIKDASHCAFYAGAAKGFVSAIEGLLLFLAHPELRARLYDSMVALFRTHTWHAAVAALVVVYMRVKSDSVGELLWTFSRWARIVTVTMTFLLGSKLKATEAMFFDALHATHPAFADAVRSQPPIRSTPREKLERYKRIAKMTAFRLAGTIVAHVVPGGKFIVIPVIKYISMRPTLGGPVATAVAAIHVLPDSILAQSHIDDFLMSFSEAVIDATELGNDSVRPYIKRLDSGATREYFRERYRGYVTGMGFFYSVLMQVPFLGIPLVVIAECGAAVMVVDIVARNLEKDARLPLTGEQVLVIDKGQRASAPIQSKAS